MQDTIEKLRREAIYHRNEADKREKAIKSLQAVCGHSWQSDGHDSHHDYKKCTICGKREQC